MKHIDAEKLLAEIERRREKCADIAADERNEEVAEYYRGKEVAYDETSTLITSLQREQPEVDLEKEIENEWRKCHPTDEGMGDESALLVIEQFHQITHHFYELGLNARKEE